MADTNLRNALQQSGLTVVEELAEIVRVDPMTVRRSASKLDTGEHMKAIVRATRARGFD